MKIMKILCRLFAAIVLITYLQVAIAAQTSIITYNGSIAGSGLPANSTCDIELVLYDAASGGSQIGSAVSFPTVAVTDNNFAVDLNFGSAAFPGADRYVEVRVRVAGDPNPRVAINPRNRVTSVPYSIQSLNSANTAQLGGVAANQFVQTGDSRLTDARNPLAGSSSYIQNGTAVQASADFNITGSGSANAFNATTQYNIGGSRVLSIAGTLNTFAGVGAGSSNVSGVTNSFFGHSAGQANTSGSYNAFFGYQAGLVNTGFSNSFFGRGSGAANSTGGSNSFVGATAGQGNTSGANNTFMGASAGSANTTGSNNSALGFSASFTGGGLSYSTVLGAGTTSGTSNSITLGRSGGQDKIIVPGTVISIGQGDPTTSSTYVGWANGVAGARNTFFGSAAGFSNQGSDNTYIGVSAAGFVSSGNFNTYVGSNTATQLAGDHNTALGAGAGSTAYTTLSYATAIGAGTTVNSSNTIVLGRDNGFDAVRVPGLLIIPKLGPAGSTTLCRNSHSQLSTCSSSLRYKTDVRSFSRGLDVVRRLRPITFNWKEDGTHDVGFGAEEVAAVEPLLTTTRDDGVIEGVKYAQITTVLVNAVKEQQAQIEAQQKLIDAQQKQIDALKALICAGDAKAAICKAN